MIGTSIPAPARGHASTPTAPREAIVSSSTERASRPRIATGRGVTNVVWQSIGVDGSSPDADVMVSRSVDGGRTWSSPRRLVHRPRGALGADQSPQLTTDGRGHWLAAWWSNRLADGSKGNDSDVLLARSVDDGRTWSAAAPLNANASTAAGWDYVPQIVTDGRGQWIAAWWSDDTLGDTIGKDHDILFARSSDLGRTWSPPRPLNADAATDRGDDRLPQLATDGRGRWLAVWESTNQLGAATGPDTEIAVARSVDDGRTWSPPAALDPNAGAEADLDTEPRIATDANGTWIVVWHATRVERGMITADTRILTARSTDGGNTWSAPQGLTTPEPGSGRSALQPVVAADRSGAWAVVWWERTRAPNGRAGTAPNGARIMLARSLDNGRSWLGAQPVGTPDGDARTPDLVMRSDGGFLLAWESDARTTAGRRILVRSIRRR